MNIQKQLERDSIMDGYNNDMLSKHDENIIEND